MITPTFRPRRNVLRSCLTLLFAWSVVWPLAASAEIRSIGYPTDPSQTTLTDSFGQQRSGHLHEGDDILGKKMLPLYAAVDGRVEEVVYPEASWGYAVVISDGGGYTYHYLHVNNDTPGTDDDAGGMQYAYAPGIERGVRVTRGQLLGWMGDSGNAEDVTPHLHFEIRLPDGTAIDPYPSLAAALNGDGFDPAAATKAASDINADKGVLATGATPPCVSGARIKTEASKAVYFCGADGKRYVFPNDRTYFTWYADFTGVTTITAEQMAAVPLGKNVTYRPGVKLVKIQTDPKVYAVDVGGTLRWVQTSEIAAALYGSSWAKKVEDVPETFFTDYRVGKDITTGQRPVADAAGTGQGVASL